jgi:hypothetical protein
MVNGMESPSVSGQQAVQRSLENAGAFRAMVDEVLQATGGVETGGTCVGQKDALAAKARSEATEGRDETIAGSSQFSIGL